MAYFLTTTDHVVEVKVSVEEVRLGDRGVTANLALPLKGRLSREIFDEQQTFLYSAANAAYAAFNPLDQKQRFKAKVGLQPSTEDGYTIVKGSSSSGLAYCLSVFEKWWRIVLRKQHWVDAPIFATGEVKNNGDIKSVGFVEEKLKRITNFLRENEITESYICLPTGNKEDVPTEVLDGLSARGAKVIFSSNVSQLLGELLESHYDGSSLGRWEPFKGLASFEYQDSMRFFGRDKDVQRLYDDLQSNEGVLIVSGPSGSGKSSLIKAGLIPYLEQKSQTFTWFTTTPKVVGSDFISAIYQHILNSNLLKDNDDTDKDPQSSENYRSVPVDELKNLKVKDNALLLFQIDQFEEFFTSCDNEYSSEAIQQLHHLTIQCKWLKVVFSTRNEYLSLLLDSGAVKSPVISNVSGNLQSDELKEVVIKQAEFSGYTFEENEKGSLAQKIIEDALRARNVLPMLEFVLQKLSALAENSDRPNILQFDHYLEIGGLKGAIAQHAERAIRQTGASTNELSYLFSVLVGISNEGLPYPRKVALTSELNKVIAKLINKLIDAKIITSTDSKCKNHVCLSHDSLFTHWEALSDWVKHQEDFLYWKESIDRDFTKWLESRSNHDLITDTKLLKQARMFRTQNIIYNPLLVNYVKKSLIRNRQKAIIFTSTLILPFFATALFWWSENRIVTEYHTQIAERYSVPYGLKNVPFSKVRKRLGTYKLEYQGGKLRELSYVNHAGYPIPLPGGKGFDTRKYYYSEGALTRMVEEDYDAIKDDMVTLIKIDKKKNEAILSPPVSRAMTTRTRSIGSSTLTTTYSDVAKIIYQYDKNGFVIKKMAYDTYGKKTLFDSLYHKAEYNYDSIGLIRQIKYLDVAGNNSNNLSGVHEATFDYDSSRLDLTFKRYKYENVDITTDCNHDDYGNISVCEINHSSAKTGKHSISKVMITSSEGFGTIKQEYIYEDYFETNKLIKNIISSYDSMGRLIRLYAESPEGNLVGFSAKVLPENIGFLINNFVTLSDIFSKIKEIKRIDYFDNDFIKSISYEIDGIDEALEISFTYDDEGKFIKSIVSSNSLYNLKRSYTLPSKEVNEFPHGFNELWITNSTHNGTNNLVKLHDYRYVGPSGKEIYNFQLRHQYNENGKVIKEQLFSNGNPVKTDDFSHLNKLSYDKLSNLVRWSGYNELGIAETIPFFGAHEMRLAYDEKRFNGKSYWDINGLPIESNKKGHHKKEYIYDEHGNYLSTSFYDSKGNEITLNEDAKARTKHLKEKLYTYPDGASVYDFNGIFLGFTPLEIDSSSSRYGKNLTYKKSGYEDVSVPFGENFLRDAINLVRVDNKIYKSMTDEYLSITSSLNQNIMLDSGILNKIHDLAKKGNLESNIYLLKYYKKFQNDKHLHKQYQLSCEKFENAPSCMLYGLFLDFKESKYEEALVYYLSAIKLGYKKSHYFIALTYQRPEITQLDLALEHAEAYWSFDHNSKGAYLIAEIATKLKDPALEKKWRNIAFSLDPDMLDSPFSDFYKYYNVGFRDFASTSEVNHGKALILLKRELLSSGHGGYESIFYEMVNCNAGILSECRAPSMLGSFY